MLAKNKTETKGQTLLGKEASANPILGYLGRRGTPLGPIPAALAAPQVEQYIQRLSILSASGL